MKLYRYTTSSFDGEPINFHDYIDTRVFLSSFEVIKETKCGSWIEVNCKKKFVNHNCTKQYAYTTVEDAKTSFLYRKNAQIKILTHQLKDAKNSKFAIDKEAQIFTNYFKLESIEFGFCKTLVDY
jgi:hypothetical protein